MARLERAAARRRSSEGSGFSPQPRCGCCALDRIPLTLCVFKGLTGLPCPTCGSTRALGRLVALDFAGALAMNPFTTVVAVVLAAWGVADLGAPVAPSRRRPRRVTRSASASPLRVGALVLFLANWVYLVAAGR